MLYSALMGALRRDCSPFPPRDEYPRHPACTNPAVCNLVRVPVYIPRGGLAQLGEHDVRNVGVAGSTPVPSTTPRERG